MGLFVTFGGEGGIRTYDLCLRGAFHDLDSLLKKNWQGVPTVPY